MRWFQEEESWGGGELGRRLRSESETQRKPEVPASPRGEALFRCARPSGVPRGLATSTGSLASQRHPGTLTSSSASLSCFEGHMTWSPGEHRRISLLKISSLAAFDCIHHLSTPHRVRSRTPFSATCVSLGRAQCCPLTGRIMRLPWSEGPEGRDGP